MYPRRVKRIDKPREEPKKRRPRARPMMEAALGAITFRMLKAGLGAMWRGVKAQAGSRDVPAHERVISGFIAAARGKRRHRDREREASEAFVIEEVPGDEGRVGRISALAMFGISVLYVATGLAGVFVAQRTTGRLDLTDPYLAILEALIVLAAPLMVVIMAAVHAAAPPAARTRTLAALCLMTAMATVTACIHFLQLAIVRRIGPDALAPLAPLVTQPWRWPNAAFALDLFAWDFLFGLSMLLGAQGISGDGVRKAARWTMRASGILCVVGTLGPALGDLRIQVLAIAGYAFVFPAACFLLARVFREET